MNATSAFSAVERTRRYLASFPPAVSGQGGHDATFRAACVCVHGFALDEAATYALLAEWNTRCLPPWSPAELAHKVRSALAAPDTRPRGHLLAEEDNAVDPMPAPPKWPAPDPARIAAALKDGPTALELWKRSPVLLDVDDGSNCSSIVSTLFNASGTADSLLCVGRSNREFATRPLSAWLASGRLPEMALVVPGPMSARKGKTKAGRESEHTLENTGPRMYLVVEFDTGGTDEHAALLWHLNGLAPLALVVHSGGKSLHGWFPVNDAPAADVERFTRYACTLGADPALFRNRSQFVRLPAGTREGGCRQSVFYWNPAALATVAAGSEVAHE